MADANDKSGNINMSGGRKQKPPSKDEWAQGAWGEEDWGEEGDWGDEEGDWAEEEGEIF